MGKLKGAVFYVLFEVKQLLEEICGIIEIPTDLPVVELALIESFDSGLALDA